MRAVGVDEGNGDSGDELCIRDGSGDGTETLVPTAVCNMCEEGASIKLRVGCDLDRGVQNVKKRVFLWVRHDADNYNNDEQKVEDECGVDALE